VLARSTNDNLIDTPSLFQGSGCISRFEKKWKHWLALATLYSAASCSVSRLVAIGYVQISNWNWK
jgi:hypothetical protein